MLLELIFKDLLKNITDAHMHAILTPWAPVGPKTFLRLFGQKQKAVTAYIFVNMYNANVHCTYQMK